MKIQIIVFVSVIFFGNLSAQNAGWELADGTTSGFFKAIYEEVNGDLVAATSAKYIEKVTKIVRLNKDGEQLAENFIINDSMPIKIYKIIYIKSSDSFLLLGSSFLKNINNSDYKIYFVAVTLGKDLALGTIKTTRFDVKGELFNMNYYLTENEEIFASVNVFSNGMGPNSEQIFVKLDKKGEILDYYVDKGHFNCYSIIKSGDEYQCLGIQIKNFDLNFKLKNIENDLHFYISPSNQNRSLRINENKILVGSSPYDIPQIANGGAVLYYVDNNMKILKKNWIKTELGPVLASNTFDISPDSSIFIANFEGLTSGLKSFSIGKFDTDLDLIWQIKYENIGKYRYQLWGMEATNDNGIILYGSRRNWNVFNDSEAYMIKFNSEGKITWTQNVDATDLVAIRIFPNPSPGPLTVDIIGITGKADIRVFDMSGRNVYVRDGITDGSTTLDLSALASGSYMYKIYQGSKEISSGKWIKM